MPQGPDAPNQVVAVPALRLGAEGRYSYDGTNHGNGFFATPVTIGTGARAAAALVDGHVHEARASTSSSAGSTGPTWRARSTSRPDGQRRRRDDGNFCEGRARFVLAALAVTAAGASRSRAQAGPGQAGGQTREYWIAAVPVNWHVAPNLRNAVEGEHLHPSKTTFETVVYRQFTKDWAKPIPNEEGDRGIQGPLLHANVGDTILVHFENLDTLNNQPHSMHFHGVHYRPGSDGAYLPGFSGPGANVRPGKSFTYRLVAGADSVGVWPYHDHSPSMDDSIAGGLYGALSILGPGEQPPDREFVVYLETTLDFKTIDGRAFVGNTPVFKRRSATSSSGTCSRSARTTTPSTCTATAGRRPAGRHRHDHGRPGGELPDPLARGGSGHVVLPLPRRGSHDAGDDRHLPGVAVRRRRLALVGASPSPSRARGAGRRLGPGRARSREVTMPGKAFAPGQIQVLVGDTVVWRNADAHEPHGHLGRRPASTPGSSRPGSRSRGVREDRAATPTTARSTGSCAARSWSSRSRSRRRPEPVVSGGRVVLSGLAPTGTAKVAVVRARRRRQGRRHASRRPATAASRSAAASTAPEDFIALREGRVEPARPRRRRAERARAAERRRPCSASASAGPRRARAAVLQRYEREHFAWQDGRPRPARRRVDGRRSRCRPAPAASASSCAAATAGPTASRRPSSSARRRDLDAAPLLGRRGLLDASMPMSGGSCPSHDSVTISPIRLDRDTGGSVPVTRAAVRTMSGTAIRRYGSVANCPRRSRPEPPRRAPPSARAAPRGRRGPRRCAATRSTFVQSSASCRSSSATRSSLRAISRSTSSSGVGAGWALGASAARGFGFGAFGVGGGGLRLARGARTRPSRPA